MWRRLEKGKRAGEKKRGTGRGRGGGGEEGGGKGRAEEGERPDEFISPVYSNREPIQSENLFNQRIY